MKITGLKLELIWDQGRRSTLPYGLGGYAPTRWIAAGAKPYDLPVIPHGSSVHNHRFVMANTNSPFAEFLSVGKGTDIQPIFNVLKGEPLLVNGKISLDPCKPGFGVEPKRELLSPCKGRKWKMKLQATIGLFLVAGIGLTAQAHTSLRVYSGDVSDQSRAVTNAPITVAAYYYPCTHPDPRWDKNKYPGYTEWDEIKAAKPRFPGHVQPKPPLWGYQNEALPEVMAQKINAAADYGVNVFIFDWYYYNDGPYLEAALDEGFLHATNNARVQFALMWANHDWYDIQGYNPADPNLKLLYPGKVTPATWDKICDLVIARYFKHPSYWLVEGKPYFSIYEMSQFLDSFGSLENARAGLDKFRSKVRAAGFPGVHVNAIVWGEPNLPGGKTPPGWPKLCRELALDSLTSYTWVHHGALNYGTFPTSDYLWGRQKYLAFWARAVTNYSVPYFPNAMINWDNSPRAAANADWSHPGAHVVNPVVTGNTPAAFQQSLEIIKQRLLAAPTQPKIITINAWNEWPEGSCLEPETIHGMGYLEAVKAVFGGTR